MEGVSSRGRVSVKAHGRSSRGVRKEGGQGLLDPVGMLEIEPGRLGLEGRRETSASAGDDAQLVQFVGIETIGVLGDQEQAQ